MLVARLARPCLHRPRESWICPAGSRLLTIATPAPALSPAVLGRRRDAAAPRPGQGGVAEHSSDVLAMEHSRFKDIQETGGFFTSSRNGSIQQFHQVGHRVPDRCSPSTCPTPPQKQAEDAHAEPGRLPTRAWLLAAVQKGGCLLRAGVGQLVHRLSNMLLRSAELPPACACAPGTWRTWPGRWRHDKRRRLQTGVAWAVLRVGERAKCRSANARLETGCANSSLFEIPSQDTTQQRAHCD